MSTEEISQTKAAYDQAARSYDAVRYRTKAKQYQDQLERAFIRRWIKPGGNVLEIGSGTGRITAVLLEQAASVTAVDISGEMLQTLRSKLGQPQHLRFVQASVLDLKEQLAGQTFDAVVSMRALPHVRETARALNIVADMLNPDGQAILDFWNNQSFLGYARSLLGRKHKIPTFHHTYATMRSLVDQAGFSVDAELPLWIYPRVGPVALDGLQSAFVKKYAYSVVFAMTKQPVRERS